MAFSFGGLAASER